MAVSIVLRLPSCSKLNDVDSSAMLTESRPLTLETISTIISVLTLSSLTIASPAARGLSAWVTLLVPFSLIRTV